MCCYLLIATAYKHAKHAAGHLPCPHVLHSSQDQTAVHISDARHHHHDTTVPIIVTVIIIVIVIMVLQSSTP